MRLLLRALGSTTILSALALAGPTSATPTAGAQPGPLPVLGAGHGHFDPAHFDPARFEHPRPQTYFPLRPGSRTRLVGRDGGERFVEVVVVTPRTRRILGVRTRVVRDVVRREDGTLAERTHDWYAADDRGAVWYFGERTATFDEQGWLESREGSWRAGRHGARPGIIFPAHPRAGLAYRQEFLRGHAEDQAWIVGRHGHLAIPVGDLHHVVRTYEWSRLEPGVLSLKLYAPGIGIVRERDVAGGSERFVAVHHRGSAAGHPSGSAAKAALTSRYQPIDFLGWRQRLFIASRAS